MEEVILEIVDGPGYIEYEHYQCPTPHSTRTHYYYDNYEVDSNRTAVDDVYDEYEVDWDWQPGDNPYDRHLSRRDSAQQHRRYSLLNMLAETSRHMSFNDDDVDESYDIYMQQSQDFFRLSLLERQDKLLSQLSSVRNRAAAAQSVSSQLQQLEMQLQSTRQQLERMPRRQGEVNRMPPGTATAPIANPESGFISSHSSNASESQFLLARAVEESLNSGSRASGGGGGSEPGRLERNMFVQELLLSAMSEQVGQSPLSLSDDPTLLLESLSLSRSEKAAGALAAGSGVGASGTGSSPTGTADAHRGGRVSVVEAPCRSRSPVGSGTAAAAVGGGRPVGSTSPTPGSSRGASGQPDGRSMASHPASRPPHLAAGPTSPPPSSQPHGSTVNLNEHAMNDPPPPPPPRQAAGSLSPRDAGRLNPAAAKRSMLKHLPASRGGATDMDPPPH